MNFKIDPLKIQRAKKIGVILLAIILIAIVGAIFANPKVAFGLRAMRAYISGSVQGKAWNEAKKQVLEKDMKETKKSLDQVSPQSFLDTEIPTAKAAEIVRPALNVKIEAYLKSNKSPLAEYTDLLMEQSNWMKIISISNAESSFCNKMPANKFNCWGVGGSNLWDFGDSLADGITGMNTFLNNYPQASKKKYASMSIMEMNGVWNQPATATWSGNNYAVMEDLIKLEVKN